MSKRMKTVIMLLCIVIIASLAFGAGCAVLKSNTPTPVTNPSQGIEVISQAWDIIFTDYVEKDKLDPAKLSQAAVKALVETLNDPHTSYIEPEYYQLGVSGLQGSFEGIGAHIALKDGQMVLSPISGSPAEKAGIRTGDVLLEVDGNSTEGMSLEKVVLLVRGPKGTPVHLLVKPEGDAEPVLIQVIRDEIQIASVFSEVRGDILYLNIREFSQNTDQEVTGVLQSIAGKNLTGIVLDLRNNPGGLLTTVIDVASHFVTSGAVVSVIDNQQNQTVYAVKTGVITTDLPMVVLVNSYSASGSEVLSGALQDYGRAVIAGTTTYGKGSVNILRELNDGSGIYITTARWYTPNGRPIEGKGIEPDPGFVLEQTGEDAINWAIGYLHNQQPKQTVALSGAFG